MKNFAITGLILFVLAGCKPAQISFQQTQLNKAYVQNLFNVANQPATITGGKVFVADLTEDFVDRDGIGEKTIVNQGSNKEQLGVPLIDKSYKLFIITAKDGDNRNCVFIPAIFNAGNECIGLGPALIGNYGAGEIVFFKRLIFYSKKKHGKTGWVYDEKESEFKKSKSIFDPYDHSKTKINIAFQTDDEKDIPELRSFRITRILQLSDNRFGGNKPLVYNIASVFEDPDALLFTFLHNL